MATLSLSNSLLLEEEDVEEEEGGVAVLVFGDGEEEDFM